MFASFTSYKISPSLISQQPSSITTHSYESENINSRKDGLRQVPKAQQDDPRHAGSQEEDRDVLWLPGVLIFVRAQEVGDAGPDGHLKGAHPESTVFHHMVV
jgi:hypothetical protein